MFLRSRNAVWLAGCPTNGGECLGAHRTQRSSPCLESVSGRDTGGHSGAGVTLQHQAHQNVPSGTEVLGRGAVSNGTRPTGGIWGQDSDGGGRVGATLTIGTGDKYYGKAGSFVTL